MLEKERSVAIIAVLLSLCFIKPVFAEIIILKSGDKVEGELIERTDDYIKIDFYGIPIPYYYEDIESIDGEKIKGLFKPAVSPADLEAEKTAAQILEESAPAIVAIDGVYPHRVNAGSGFIVDKSCIVMTNFHVIAGAERINLILKNKLRYPAIYILAFNPERDICVLKIEAPNLSILPLGNSDSLRPGQNILAVGVLGQDLEYKIAEGQFLRNSKLYGQSAIQFSGSATSGYSGGPLFDMQGRVVGINTNIEMHSKSLNFAIPINEVRDLMSADTKITIEAVRADKISRAYAFFGEGNTAFSQGDFHLSIDYYKQAIATYPVFIEAHSKLGNSYVLIEAPDEAINVFKKAIAIDSSCTFLYNGLTIAYGKKGMLNEAITTIKKGISMDCNDPRQYATLGMCYLAQGMLDEAIEQFEKAVVVDSSFDTAYVDLAYAYYENG